MHRTAFKCVVALLVVAASLGPAPAGAAPPAPSPHAPLMAGTATSTDHGVVTPGDGCEQFHSITEGTFTGELNGKPGTNPGDTGTWRFDQCLTISGVLIHGVGRHLITTPLGTMDGLLVTSSCLTGCTPATYSLLVEHGTGAYSKATGDISAEVTSFRFDSPLTFLETTTMVVNVTAIQGPMFAGGGTTSTTGSFGDVGECGFVKVIADSTFTGTFDGTAAVTPGDSGTIHTVECVDYGVDGFFQHGTFELTTGVGTMHGTTSGFSVGISGSSSWTVTGGTGAYAHASGWLFTIFNTTFGPNQTFTGNGILAAGVTMTG